MGVRAWVVALLAGVAVACGGAVDRKGDASGGPSGSDSPSQGGASATSDGGAALGGGGAGFAGSGGDPAYMDPGCPDVPPPAPVQECDPFATVDECGFGNRCVPFVEYADDDCNSEAFGTYCAPEGPGTQGADCTQVSCAAQHVCVTSGQGNQCVRICRLDVPEDCQAGLICQPLDVDGFHICF